jgi:hypothetical protein
MEKAKLDEILAKHLKWANGEEGGERANLIFADLRFADLRSANLRSANLSSADLRSANLRSANLSSADLRSANLSSADLRSANLSSADLRSANLSSADLISADLSSADLRSADLSSANLRETILGDIDWLPWMGIVPDARGYARAYKLTNSKKEGIYKRGIVYGKKGKVAATLDTDVNQQCGSGINLATLQWCLRELKQAGENPHLYIYQFRVSPENVCAPMASDGKFRVGEATLVGECDLNGRLLKQSSPTQE